MGRYERSGIGIAVRGYYEEDYLQFDDPLDVEDRYLSATGMVERAVGHEIPRERILTAFRYPDEPFWRDTTVNAYRKESGRRYPPVYRIKVVVEVEVLPDDECEAYWERRREKRNATA